MGKEYSNLFHSKALKNYQNWNFWFENIPSGNPDQEEQIKVLLK
jgi:hypothetical protein